jgi:hypothetical protein
MMGSSSRKKIYKLKQRLKLRNEKSTADRKAVEALLTRIVKLKAKQNKSVKAAENRMIEHRERLACVRAERDRAKQIKAAQRAGIRNERLWEKHFTNRTSFKHVVYSMAEAQPNEISRYHLGLCSFVHLTKALRSLGAPIERDFRRPSRHSNDCQVFLNNEWVTIPIRGIDGARAYVPVAPVEPPVVEDAQPEPTGNGPITFNKRTTYAELMSGRVIVASLHERAVFPYQHDYSVQKMENDGRFYVAHAGTWELIPGQPAPPSPPQKPIDILYGWQGEGTELEIEPAQWTPPEPPTPAPEPEPTFSWERIRELRKRLAELNGKES